MAPSRPAAALKVGRALARVRREAGWTQEQLAHRSGLHRTYIGGVERGERNPTVISLLAICNALDIRVWELLRTADL